MSLYLLYVWSPFSDSSEYQHFFYFVLKGTVRLLFQPAEEGGAGALHMIKEGALEGVGAIFGMHVDYQLPTGSISSYPGPTNAAVCFFEAKIEGKSGNAASPHLNVDSVLSVTYVKGGESHDTTPPFVEFGGTLRSLTTDGLYRLQRRVKEVIEGQALVHMCKAFISMKDEEYPAYPAVENDERLHQHVQKIGSLMLGPDNVKMGKKIMAGEDFAFYQQLIPGVIFGIGMANEKLGAVHSAHSPYFFIDEKVLPIGAALHSAIAEAYLDERRKFEGQCGPVLS
ncbi:IAA-amino acid hydrolase ILR1-like 5 isoform X1 [Asparagus officinalis]|uniref:IAA-amino acid hydrolase ILR1-like 5 isoform X1 n=1 Tax=Asparagus officinalis TaxID=4686 RepID=UPI00098E5240|nr:IAA-amino acid hydrolase ILR1-like 5 isoform X1 [Asparagus officinalis]